MSNLPDKQPQAVDAANSRIDAPHAAVRPTLAAPAATPQPVASIPAGNPTAKVPCDDSIRTEQHALQLADRLQQQAEELDRRAALLASQEAEIETRLRSARLWIEQRQQDLDEREQRILRAETGDQPLTGDLTEREARIEQRQCELDARQADLYRQVEELAGDRTRLATLQSELTRSESQLRDRESQLGQRRRQFEAQRNELAEQRAELESARRDLMAKSDDLDEREADVAARHEQLGYRQREIEASIARYEKLGVVEERIEQLHEQAAVFAARSRHLDEAEQMLAEQTEHLSDFRAQIERERSSMEEKLITERQSLTAGREQWQAERQTREQQLEERTRQLDAREQSLDQLRGELENGQREMLEMRLATEETWSQLAGALAPASLTKAISQTRARLADHYQISLEDIECQRSELERLQAQLAAEHQALSQQRDQLHEWALRREEDLQEQAVRLVTREQELNRQQRLFEQVELEWAAEREQLQTRVRELLADLRSEVIRHAA